MLKPCKKYPAYFYSRLCYKSSDRNRRHEKYIYYKNDRLKAVKSGGATQIRTGGEGFADPSLTSWLWRRALRKIRKKNGAGNGIRTRDIHLGKVTLYH